MAFTDKFTSARSLVYDTYGKPIQNTGTPVTVKYNQGIIDLPSSKAVQSFTNSGSNLGSFKDKFNSVKELAYAVYGEPVTVFNNGSSGSNINSLSDTAINNESSFSNGTVTSNNSNTTPSFGATAKPIIYSDWSPNAQYFGMDQATAYAEHMANTAHQREVADLKAAGLNPVLGISGSGASSVSGSVPSVSSGKKVSDNGIVDVIGATAGLVGLLVSKKPSVGYALRNVVTSLGKLKK